MTGALALRADADARMGTGHVMRCLALGQHWLERGGRAAFLWRRMPAALARRLAEEGFQSVRLPEAGGEPAGEVAAAARGAGAEWVVLDGYHFGAEVQAGLREAGARVMALDDHGHAGRYAADAVLNQNGHADEGFYRDRAPDTALLLGPRYALLRREFRARGPRARGPRLEKLLVTLGGSDPDDVTGRVMRALARLDGEPLDVRVVSGPGRLGGARGEAAGPHRVRIEEDARNMAELMDWADAAVSAGGTTTWELARMGVPFLCIPLADNQRPVAAWLAREDLADVPGWHADLDEARLADRLAAFRRDFAVSLRRAAAFAARLDGHGVCRAAARLAGDPFWLRPAEPGDARLYWTWANEPAVREASFSTAPIPWEDHARWFDGRLAAGAWMRVVVGLDEAPAGQVRIEPAGGRTEISVSLDAARRGAGWGAAVVRRATEAYLAQSREASVTALVRETNAASRRAFEKAGYRRAGTEERRGAAACVYVRERGS